MSRSPRVRALVLGTVLALAAPAAWANPRPAREAAGLSWNLAGQLWHALTAAWSGLGLWNDAGCSVDPSGACGDGPREAAAADNGCTIDPDGGCAAADSGCSLDPSGRCAAGPADLDTAMGENGCSIDPNGGGCG